MPKIRDADIPSPFGAEIEARAVTRVKRERTVESAGDRYAKKLGFKKYKVRFVGQDGFPDKLYLGASKRQHLWWEWKRPGETPDDRQNERIAELKNAGWNVGWSDNVEDFRKALDAVAR